MTLPPAVRDARRVAGGDINEGWRVVLDDGSPAFVKTRADAAPGEYALEATGLRWLAEPASLPVPRVLAVDDAYLALEWIDHGRLGEAGEERLGRGLAALHYAGAESFGGRHELRIGPVALPNAATETWPEFYATRRLEPLLRRVELSDSGRRAVTAVCERIDQLAGPAEPPARLHGDLWGGNVLADRQGQPWLIDPAAHGGHREVDLAMLRLFGGMGQRTLDAYEEVHPLADGHEDRIGLWQLFPLLVHAALFGGGYGAAVERTARRYAG